MIVGKRIKSFPLEVQLQLLQDAMFGSPKVFGGPYFRELFLE